jgi:hypothetical protein
MVEQMSSGILLRHRQWVVDQMTSVLHTTSDQYQVISSQTSFVA